MAEPTRAELSQRLADAEARLAEAETRAAEAEDEMKTAVDALERINKVRRSALTAVMAVALAAILMLGLVAYKALDDGRGGGGSGGGQQRNSPSDTRPPRG